MNISVVIPNYNYGKYLGECVESVLKQTVAPAEILIIDDCSTDNSEKVLSEYDDHDSIKIIRNEENLGIVKNFNKAVSCTKGDYVVFVGADNRIKNDFVEKYHFYADQNPGADILYSDILLFGERANLLAMQVNAKQVSDDCFHWEFPEPSDEVIERMDDTNFLHGSSMFKRIWFDKVGGYRESDHAEDFDLFARMLSEGATPLRVPHPTLEYRQHSALQANNLILIEQVVEDLKTRIESLEGENLRLDSVNISKDKKYGELLGYCEDLEKKQVYGNRVIQNFGFEDLSEYAKKMRPALLALEYLIG